MTGPQTPPPVGEMVPTEKDRSTLPTYTVEAPDILYIEAVRVVPKPPYHIQAGDQLAINVEGTPPDSPIASQGFFVDPGGAVSPDPAMAKSRSAA